MSELSKIISHKVNQFLHKHFEPYTDFSEEINNIKEEYSKVLRELLKDNVNLQNIKQKAFIIGKKLFSQDVSYMFIMDMNDYVLPDILDFISKEEKSSKQFLNKISEIEEKIRFLENTLAYGYLSESVKHDKDWIREKLRIIKNSESTLKPFVRDHLVWVNKVLEDIRKLRSKSSVPLGHYNCELGKRLEHADGLGIFDEYKYEIINLHKKIHGSAIQIYHFIETRDFKHLLLEYLEFFNLVGKFASLLGLTFAVMYEEDANIDPLTKVLSRRSLEFILSSNFHIAKISKRPLSVAMVDIDDFKKINDRYGHQVGDCVLRKVALEIQSSLRKSDFIFRYGGEEFFILFPFATKEDAVNVLSRMLKKISEKKIKCGDFEENVTISAGVASIDEVKDIYSLISKADKALYKAKKEGKNRVAS